MSSMDKFSKQSDFQTLQSPYKVMNELDNPIDYKLIDSSIVQKNQEASKSFLDQSKISMGQVDIIKIENSRIERRINEVTVSESPTAGKESRMEGFQRLILRQGGHSQLQNSQKQYPDTTNLSQTKSIIDQSSPKDLSHSQIQPICQQIQNESLGKQSPSVNHNQRNIQQEEYQPQQSYTEVNNTRLQQTMINLFQNPIDNSLISQSIIEKEVQNQNSEIKGFSSIGQWEDGKSQIKKSIQQPPSDSFSQNEHLVQTHNSEKPQSAEKNLNYNSKLSDYESQQTIQEVNLTEILDFQSRFQMGVLQGDQYMSKLANDSQIDTQAMERNLQNEDKLNQLILLLPREMEFLTTLFNRNLIEVFNRFKLFRFIKPKNIWSAFRKKAVKTPQSNYKKYNLQDFTQGKYSKYFTLDLSSQQISLTKLLQCKWENLIELKLKYCAIKDQGWDLIVATIHQLCHLRQIDLSHNRIKQVEHSHFTPFMQLKHLTSFCIKQNPFSIESQVVLHQVNQLFSEKVSFEYSISEFPMKEFKWRKIIKLENKDLEGKIKMIQSLSNIDLCEYQIEHLSLNQLTSLKSMIELFCPYKMRLDIILEKNPLSIKSLTAIQQFYLKFKWSVLCIIHQNLTKDYHQKRLANLNIKNHVSLVFQMALRGQSQRAINKTLTNLIFKIEDIVMENKENELASKKYFQEMVDYVWKEIKIKEEKKNIRPQRWQNAEKMKKQIFQDYEKVVNSIKENIMIQLQ